MRLGPSLVKVPMQGLLAESREGLRYVIEHAGIRQVMLLSAITSILARGVIELLPAFADAVFRRGSVGLADLTTAGGVGAIAGAIVALARRKYRIASAIDAACHPLGWSAGDRVWFDKDVSGRPGADLRTRFCHCALQRWSSSAAAICDPRQLQRPGTRLVDRSERCWTGSRQCADRRRSRRGRVTSRYSHGRSSLHGARKLGHAAGECLSRGDRDCAPAAQPKHSSHCRR